MVNELLRDRRRARANSSPQVDQTLKRAACADRVDTSHSRMDQLQQQPQRKQRRRDSTTFPWISERNLPGAPIDYPRLRGMYVLLTAR